MQPLELLRGSGEGLVLRLHAAEGHRHTARAPGRKQWWLFTGAQHMRHKQHTTWQGERRDFYLLSPSSPGISKPWPQLFALLAQDSQGAVWESGSGVALLGQWHGLLPGCVASKLGCLQG